MFAADILRTIAKRRTTLNIKRICKDFNTNFHSIFLENEITFS
jgi:hypothetical protein